MIGRLLKNGAIAAAYMLLYPVYFLSGLVPRRADLWVFGSWGGYRFADNAAAFFLYCAEELGDSIDLVWISRRSHIVSALRTRGYRAHWIWSPRGILYCLRARVYLFDCFSKDINFWLSRNALKVNLWSGVPLKTFERDINTPGSRYYSLFHGPRPVRWLLRMAMPWHVERLSQLICTAPVTQKIICSAFDVPESKVAITGYPRNDLFFRKTAAAAQVTQSLPEAFAQALEQNKRILLYLPTFRDSGKPYFNFDWARLNALLAEHDAILFYKFHPVDRSKFDEHYPNIAELPSAIDVYQILGDTDALISDYSSIIFDYLLLNKPIIYYIPDLDDFLSSSRELNFDFKEISVGPLCYTFEDLLEAIPLALAGTAAADPGTPSRAEVTKLLHSHIDGNACERVLQNVMTTVLRGQMDAPIRLYGACHRRPVGTS